MKTFDIKEEKRMLCSRKEERKNVTCIASLRYKSRFLKEDIPVNRMLHRRQTVAVYFPVKVERIYVGHARNVVQHGLNLAVQGRSFHIVLF